MIDGDLNEGIDCTEFLDLELIDVVKWCGFNLISFSSTKMSSLECYENTVYVYRIEPLGSLTEGTFISIFMTSWSGVPTDGVSNLMLAACSYLWLDPFSASISGISLIYFFYLCSKVLTLPDRAGNVTFILWFFFGFNNFGDFRS